MAQTRYWNFEADDLTAELNKWMLGILPPGLYRGFDFVPTNNLTLTLSQSLTGIKKVKTDQTQTAFMGIMLTRQGVVISEDGNVTATISANGGGNPRIDTIAYEHVYVETTGGSVATLVVIQGTASATPVAPGLTFPNRQTKIGELYIPASTSVLDAVGVVYTKEPTPFLGGHPDNFAYFDKAQTWLYQQIFTNLSLGSWEDVGISTNNQLEIGSTGHLFTYTDFATTPYIGGISDREEGTVIFVKCLDGDLYYSPYVASNTPKRNIQHPYTVSNGFVGTAPSYTVRKGDVVGLICRKYGAEVVWELAFTLRGQNAQLTEVNEYTQQQREHKGATPIYSGANTLEIESDGNFYAIDMAVGGIDSISWLTECRQGTKIDIYFKNGCIITPDLVTTPATGFIPITTHDGNPMKCEAGTIVRFIQDNATFGKWYAVAPEVRKRQLHTISYSSAGTGNEYLTLNVLSGYVKIINPTPARLYIKTISVRPWHKPGSMITIEISNRYGSPSRGVVLENKTNINGGNLSLTTSILWTGIDLASTCAKVFVTLMYNGTLWEEQYRSLNYAV